jgi:hypothetical protein
MDLKPFEHLRELGYVQFARLMTPVDTSVVELTPEGVAVQYKIRVDPNAHPELMGDDRTRLLSIGRRQP